MGITIHSGPFGKCPDCHKLTGVRLCSLTAPLAINEWECDVTLLRTILISLKENVRDGNEIVKHNGKQQEVLCKVAYCPVCVRKVKCLYWFDAGGGALSSPCCKYCLRLKSRTLENADGEIQGSRVYSYTTSLTAVQQALIAAEHIGECGVEHSEEIEASCLF